MFLRKTFFEVYVDPIKQPYLKTCQVNKLSADPSSQLAVEPRPNFKTQPFPSSGRPLPRSHHRDVVDIPPLRVNLSQSERKSKGSNCTLPTPIRSVFYWPNFHPNRENHARGRDFFYVGHPHPVPSVRDDPGRVFIRSICIKPTTTTTQPRQKEPVFFSLCWGFDFE